MGKVLLLRKVKINYCVRSELVAQALIKKPQNFFSYHGIDNNISKCPAMVRGHRNTFVFDFPFDYHTIFNEKLDFDSNLKPEVTRKSFTFGSNAVQVVPIQFIFWSDRDCYMESWGKDFNNLVTLRGCYNIRNWIRPIHPSYYILDNKKIEITLEKDKPWFFVNFQTDEKVQLEYNFDKSIEKEAILMGKSTDYVTGLKKYFNIFEKIRSKKLTK